MTSMKMQPFGVRLKNILLDRSMSQSDLARRMWPGETMTDARGYDSPVGKDSVSKWINNRATPDAKNLKRLADVLGMTIEELAPDLLARETRNEPKEIEMTMIAGRPDVARLTINTMVPTDVAVKVLSLITSSATRE